MITVLLPIISTLPPFSGFGTQKDFIGGFASAGVFVLLALGLNVVVGFAGLLDLGYAAFFAIGAYTYAYSASGFTGLEHPVLADAARRCRSSRPSSASSSARQRCASRGDYLAIVTLGFGEIVPVVFLNADKYTNGTNGITGIAQPNLLGAFGVNGFGFTNPWPYYLTIVVIITIVVILLYRLQDSRLGRAWVALREDELAAASMGINTVTTKLLAFSIGASTAGLAGVFYAAKLSTVTPDQFGFTVSFTALAMVVLGGMGNIWGVAAGAFIIYELQSQGLKQLGTFATSLNVAAFTIGPLTVDIAKINFYNYQYLLYGLLLVVMMLFRPEGLFPSRRRRRELHETPGEDELTATDPSARVETSGDEG